MDSFQASTLVSTQESTMTFSVNRPLIGGFRIENTLWLINSYLFKVDSFRLIRLWHGVDFEHPATSIFKSFNPGDDLGEVCHKFQL